MDHIFKLSLIFLCLFGQAQTEDNKFNVIHQGKLLGTLDAAKTINGNSINYQSNTNIEYHLMIAITILYKYNVTYIDHVLNEAKAHIVVRGKDKTKVRTVKKNNNYEFYSNEEVIKTLKSPIKHSIIQLVFEEPIGVSKVYAEEHGEFHTIKKIADHTYLKTAPNGHKSKYFYKNGVLQKSDIDAGIIKFSIVRKN